MPTNFKLGTHRPGVGLQAYRHANAYERREDSSGAHLAIAPSAQQCGLVVLLSTAIQGPFKVQYDLLAGTESFPEGRYELAQPLGSRELRTLVQEFGSFFEQDARHDLRIESVGWREYSRVGGLLVYDQHNFIFAYGPVDAFERLATISGLSPGPVELPIPHSHHIRPEFDCEAVRLLTERQWRFLGAAEGT